LANAFFVTATDTDAGKTLVTSALLYLAAQASLNTIALKPLSAGCEQTEQGLRNADALKLQSYATLEMDYDQVVEGAGGWRVPLNARECISHLVKQLDIPVILVIGMKLGCLNHALLTAEAIARDGVPIMGWVATQTDPDMLKVEENLATLTQRFRAPLLGFIPWLDDPSPEKASQYLDLNLLLET